jgi:hypothetical protein
MVTFRPPWAGAVSAGRDLDDPSCSIVDPDASELVRYVGSQIIVGEIHLSPPFSAAA